MEYTSSTEVELLTKQTIASAAQLGADEVRCLVDFYYASQEDRKRANNQLRALSESGEPTPLIAWLAQHSGVMERQIARALEAWTDGSKDEPNVVGQWCKSHYGVGPILTAGLLAHIDIERAPTVGHIWRFAGLDPTDKWERGQKRPWNASLKVLCFKLGDCFMKFHNHEDCRYGHIYAERKAYEIERNERGDNAEIAKAALASGHWKKGTPAYTAYSAGKLPAGQIERRAQRYAVKWFLGDLHNFWYRHHYGKPAPLPWVIEHGGHAHYIGLPE